MFLDAMTVSRRRFDAMRGCYRTGCLVLVLSTQIFLWLFLGQAKCASVVLLI